MAKYVFTKITEKLPDDGCRVFEVESAHGSTYRCVIKRLGMQNRMHLEVKRCAGVTVDGTRRKLMAVMTGGTVHRELEELVMKHVKDNEQPDLTQSYSGDEMTLAKLDAESHRMVISSVEDINGSVYKVIAGWPLAGLGSSFKFRVSRENTVWRNPVDNWGVQINWEGGWHEVESKGIRARVVAATIRHIMGEIK